MRAFLTSSKSAAAVAGLIVCLTVGAPLIGHGTLLWMLCITRGQRELGRSMTDWPNAFFQYIPSWFAPSHAAAVGDPPRGSMAPTRSIGRGPAGRCRATIVPGTRESRLPGSQCDVRPVSRTPDMASRRRYSGSRRIPTEMATATGACSGLASSIFT